MIRKFFSKTIQSASMNKEIFKSHNAKIRLYEVIFKSGEGISVHSHPLGEDCAYVIKGELAYNISNNETITVDENEVVFGWKNCIHGYLNEKSAPLQLLIFISPEEIGLEYPKDTDYHIKHPNKAVRKLSPDSSEIRESEFSKVEFIAVKDYKQQLNKGEVCVLIDIKYKEAYIFDREEVQLKFSEERRMLKYLVKNGEG